jgi:hypothetical protein
MRDKDSQKQNMHEPFETALNSAGYSFQYSVLAMAERLFEEGKSPWSFEAAEFPVDVKGKGTKIDFILRLNHSPFIFLLAECKRANPAYCDWYFARAPFTIRNRSQNYYYIEGITREALPAPGLGLPTLDHIVSTLNKPTVKRKPYHIAIPIKTFQKGDAKGDAGDAIEKSLSQICLGLNGKIEFFVNNLRALEKGMSAFFFPVIFTTANLWTTSVDLRMGDMETGCINVPPGSLEKKYFILYQYNLSPGIKHSAKDFKPWGLGEIMESDYVRTIAIVNPKGIKRFLKWLPQIF